MSAVFGLPENVTQSVDRLLGGHDSYLRHDCVCIIETVMIELVGAKRAGGAQVLEHDYSTHTSNEEGL